jgi:methyl-accepting chemotaxis protein
MADKDLNGGTHPPSDSHGGGELPPPNGHEQITDSQLNAFAIDRLSQAFETSAKRWELIVYPSLFAFIILAAYGFYLVFSLAKDVHYLAISVDSNMTVMASNIQSMSDNMSQMSANIRSISVGVDSMARDVSTLEPMLTSIQNLDRSVGGMTFTTANMRDDMAVMNRNFGRPMQFMNWFMPW